MYQENSNNLYVMLITNIEFINRYLCCTKDKTQKPLL